MIEPACSGQTQYLSWDKANRALRRRNRRFGSRKGFAHMHIYRCRLCQCFHIGRSAHS